MRDLNVWVLIPSAMKAHVDTQFKKWQGAGYKLGILVDRTHVACAVWPDLTIAVDYPGVWQAWNILAQSALRLGADVCVLAGDDMDPDPNLNAQEIAQQYLQKYPDGFGVMQPCGDTQGDIIDGMPNSGRICGSPWVGKGWVRNSYGGQGPVNADYNSFYADEELKLYANKYGVLWMRPDLSQFHRHWSWSHLPKQPYHDRNQKFWEADKALFEARKKAGFP